MLGWSFFLIAGFMAVELVAGLMTNALVLLADAGHMFLDATALGLSWWAAWISAKGFDQKLSYGYHRFQVLAAFINGLTLIALVVWIAFEAVTGPRCRSVGFHHQSGGLQVAARHLGQRQYP